MCVKDVCAKQRMKPPKALADFMESSDSGLLAGWADQRQDCTLFLWSCGLRLRMLVAVHSLHILFGPIEVLLFHDWVSECCILMHPQSFIA